MEQDLCSADDLLRGEAPRVTQVAENGLHIKGKMNDGEPPPLTCIPFPAYNVDKGLTPLNNIFCSILHRDLEFTQILGQSLCHSKNGLNTAFKPFFYCVCIHIYRAFSTVFLPKYRMKCFKSHRFRPVHHQYSITFSVCFLR